MKNKIKQDIEAKNGFPVNIKSFWETLEEIIVSYEYQKDGFDCTTTIRINKNNLS